MAYSFIFDLSKLPKELLDETTRYLENKGKNQKISDIAVNLVRRFHVDRLTGLSFNESTTLIEDLLDIQIKNKILKRFFNKADKKALFLPHCCRKHMDFNCKAIFKSDTSSYECRHCSRDCMVSQATLYAKKQGYDVYILPGSACLRKIFDKQRYEGIVGVACTDEIKLASKSIMKLRIPAQAIPLLKNGCADTTFNLKTLKKILTNENKIIDQKIAG